MKYIKQLNIIIICFFFAFSPLVTLGSFSYAENTPPAGGGTASNWVPVEDKEALVASFKAYCKSRNLDISHVPNTVKAIVAWDYNQLELFAGLADIDLVSLQAHIWYAYENNEKVKFFIDKTGVVGFANLYGAIIQQEGLSPNTDKTLYSGKWFQDDNGNGAYCYIVPRSNGARSISETTFESEYKKGSLFNTQSGGKMYSIMASEQVLHYVVVKNGAGFNYYLCCGKDIVYNRDTYNFVGFKNSDGYERFSSADYCLYFNDDYYEIQEGNTAIIYSNASHLYYIGVYNKVRRLSDNQIKYNCIGKVSMAENIGTDASINASQGDSTNPPSNKNIIINTNDTTINNYITNNNQNITYDYTDDDPTNPPVYTNPYDDNPTGTTINPDGGINFQMPDLNFDWNLHFDVNNLPFPFSIPFDIVSFLNALDQEAVTPEFEIPFTIAEQEYEVEISLHDFDPYMPMIRNLIALGYCISLLVATRGIFKVY